MNKIKSLLLAGLLTVACAMPASAQFSWGPKVGFTTSELHFDESVIDSDNQTGFTGGLMGEFMLPVFNLGVDASVMYVHRAAKVGAEGYGVTTIKRDYVEIPINLKWKIGLPVVSNIVTPYIFTGPSFAFLCSKKDFKEFAENKTCDVTWNFGIGLQLLSKVQIGANYGLGLSKSVEAKLPVNAKDSEKIYSGKDRYWTVTAAYLF